MGRCGRNGDRASCGLCADAQQHPAAPVQVRAGLASLCKAVVTSNSRATSQGQPRSTAATPSYAFPQPRHVPDGIAAGSQAEYASSILVIRSTTKAQVRGTILRRWAVVVSGRVGSRAIS
jgi:hypothetical protein